MIGIAPRPSMRPMNVLVTSKPWSPAARTSSHESRSSPLRTSVSRATRPPSHGVSVRTSSHGGPASHESVRSFRTPNAGMRRRPSAHRWGSTRGASSVGTRTFDGMASAYRSYAYRFRSRRPTASREPSTLPPEAIRRVLPDTADQSGSGGPSRSGLPSGTRSRGRALPRCWSLPTSISKKTATGRSERRCGEGFRRARASDDRTIFSQEAGGWGARCFLGAGVVAIFGPVVGQICRASLRVLERPQPRGNPAGVWFRNPRVVAEVMAAQACLQISRWSSK